MFDNIRALWKRLEQTARLMVGVRDYEAYLGHLRERHPHARAMSREEFFRACQEARYAGEGRGIDRCPC